jgi:hypothetical protein
MEMYGSCLFVMRALYACQHILSMAQPRRICPIWHGTFCSVMSQKMVFETWKHWQVKITTDMTGYAPAGKIDSFSSLPVFMILSGHQAM